MDHFRVLIQVRWQIFRNSLRRSNRKAEIAMQAIGLIFGGLAVLATSIAFGAVTVMVVQAGKPLAPIGLMLWVAFLLWQLAPVLVEAHSPGLTFREIARYPTSFTVYFLFNAAYGLLDPAAITALCWLFAIWLGVLLSSPSWALVTAVAFSLFAVFNLLCNRLLMGLLERYQNTRKGRERVVIVSLIAVLLPQLIQLTWSSSSGFRPPAWLLGLVDTIHGALPPGMVTQAISNTGLAALLPMLGLAAYSVPVWYLLHRQMKEVYEGEVYSESQAVRRELKVRPGFTLSGLDNTLAAIIEKEFIYIRQNSRLLILFGYPIVIFLVVILGPGRSRNDFLRGGSPLVQLAALSGLLLLSASNLAYNIFGMDGEGFGRWLLAPLPLRKIIMAKNLVQGSILTAIYLLISVVTMALSGLPLLPYIAMTLTFATILVIQFAMGNLFSVYWPKRIQLAQMSSRLVSPATGFASLLMIIPIAGLIAAVVLAAQIWQLPWLPLAASAVAFPLALKAYSMLLNRSVEHCYQHLHEIGKELGV